MPKTEEGTMEETIGGIMTTDRVRGRKGGM